MLCNAGMAPSPIFPTYYSPHATARKRRAASPPSAPSPSTPTSSWDPSTPAPKRHRPNLANGFSSLSLDHVDTPGPSSLPSYSESQQLEECRKRIDDDDLFDTGAEYDHNDVVVEEVPPRARRPHFGQRSNSSSTSGYSSDATIPPLRQTLHRSEVVLPYETQYINDINVEDVTSRKRRSASIDEGPNKRAREMDVDMGDVEEIPRRRSEWYEPEKDRIVYTALSSSSRSASPEAESPVLAQPGENGFTISPSMLTRLLARSEIPPLPFPQQREMGMVLYRPLGIPPAINDIVREWQDRLADSGRFENMDEVEDLTSGAGHTLEAAEEMDVDM